MGDATEKSGDLTDEKVRWAWDIHVDADQMLHSRIGLFVSLQAILFATFGGLLVPKIEGLDLLAWIIVAFGIAATVAFTLAQHRILSGIEYLKNDHLLKNKVYRDYFFAKERALNPLFKIKPPYNYRYDLARGAPVVVLVLWIIVAFACIAYGLIELGFPLPDAAAGDISG